MSVLQSTTLFLPFLLLSISTMVLSSFPDLTSVQINDDVLGLIVFKSEVKDPFSNLGSWNEDDNSPCSWIHVECNPVTGRVSGLSLDGLGLSGKIGKGLQKLHHLKVLSLSNNNFSGEISSDIGLFNGLENLNLSHNLFTGMIPKSVVITSIKVLDFSKNSLSGSLPDDLFQNCLSLRDLSLGDNKIEGQIPTTLGQCSSLNNLNLSNNHFSGNPFLVSGIWSLQSIRVLDLSHNALSGSLPNGGFVLHNLKELHLQNNQFSEPLPLDIGLCPHLNTLDFSNNMFTGEIPFTFQKLNSLMFLNLHNNHFTDDFPQWIGNLTSLVYLDFSNNDLMGILPFSIGNLKSLSFLSLSNNKLTGEIPMSLVYCTELSIIRLRDNNFNGSIPEGLFDLGLKEVDFSHNGLMGMIPSGSTKLFESIDSLDLSRNNLTGSIPVEMGLFANLRYLNLSWNNLNSRIPPEFGLFQNLTTLDLQHSVLFGSVPGDICESGNLGILQLDNNLLSGSIPEEIGNCSSLYKLSLSHNNLSGSIPKSIMKLTKLKILKLESNELSGEIPQELGNLENLLVVNVSYNMLIGRLPPGNIFQNLDQSSIQGNLGICSRLLHEPCKMNISKPLVIDPNAFDNQMDHNHRQRNGSANSAVDPFVIHRSFLSVSAIVAIAATVVIALGVIVVTLLNASVRRRLAFVDSALESMFSSSSRSANVATAGKLVLFGGRSTISDPEWINNPESFLDKSAEIGEGVFGTVYKVSIGTTQGKMVESVAIKRLLTSNIIQHHEDFDREVRVLGNVRHPNLISLKGYYWTPELQLLVSEYAPNGSLQSKLHERLPSTPPLTWSTRFKIIIGTAKGLSHLHHSSRPSITHYNLKPSNILLDENYNPKISDFGLARLLSMLEKHVTNNRFQSALGYVAPELACQSLRVNEKCDIYGFGVLILELVTGKRPIEYGEDNVMILSDHVRTLLEQGNVLDCVDSSFDDDYPEDEVLPVLKLALVCTSQIPSSRPSMAEIVQILQVIKTPVPQRTEIF